MKQMIKPFDYSICLSAQCRKKVFKKITKNKKHSFLGSVLLVFTTHRIFYKSLVRKGLKLMERRKEISMTLNVQYFSNVLLTLLTISESTSKKFFSAILAFLLFFSIFSDAFFCLLFICFFLIFLSVHTYHTKLRADDAHSWYSVRNIWCSSLTLKPILKYKI